MLDDISTSILVTVVDDDESVRDALKGFMKSVGFAAESFSSAEDFLGSDILDKTSCLIVDECYGETRLGNPTPYLNLIYGPTKCSVYII